MSTQLSAEERKMIIDFQERLFADARWLNDLSKAHLSKEDKELRAEIEQIWSDIRATAFDLDKLT